MKTKLSYNILKSFLSESYSDSEFVDMDDFDIDEVVDKVISSLSIFKDITYSKTDETEDYVIITVNANNPLKARSDLASWKFSHATNFIIEPMRKTSKDGFQLEVYDEDGDPFEKEVFIRIRRGGEFNAGVRNELDFLGILQQSISGNLVIQDKSDAKKQLVLDDVSEVRDCSKDAGSRMGNRADIEITYANGTKKSRLSLKKDSAHKVAGLVRRFARESVRIGKAIRAQFIEKGLQFTDRYITVPITNAELYRWCLFGNDIKDNGAVIKTDISKDDVSQEDDALVVKVNELILPTESDEELMQEFPVYMLMKMNKRGGVQILAAVIGVFGKRYLMDGLIITEVND